MLRNLLATHHAAPKSDLHASPAALPPPLISGRYERCRLIQAGDLEPIKAEGWALENGRCWECGAAGGEFELAMPGEIILMGRTIPKEAEGSVFFSVDGCEPKPIPVDPHNRPLASDLTPSRHSVKVIVKPYAAATQADAAAVVKIHYVGAAGIAADADKRASTLIQPEN